MSRQSAAAGARPGRLPGRSPGRGALDAARRMAGRGRAGAVRGGREVVEEPIGRRRRRSGGPGRIKRRERAVSREPPRREKTTVSNEKNADEQLTVTDGSVALIKLPETIGEAMAHAKILMRGELIPKEYRGHLGNVYTAIQFGAQFGLLPNQSLQRIAVINGRPSLWGDAMLGIIEATGQLSEFEESDIVADGDAAGARCFVHRVKPDGTARKRTCDFTIADAKKAGAVDQAGAVADEPEADDAVTRPGVLSP